MSKYSFSEAELRNRFIASLMERSGILFYPEVPVFCRSVDLVLQDEKTGKLTAIEFKLHDWKRAILQAQSVGICFDFLCICLPKPKTPAGEKNIVDACECNGVGLILYDETLDEFEVRVKSPRTSSVWKTQKDMIIKYLEAKSYGSAAENA